VQAAIRNSLPPPQQKPRKREREEEKQQQQQDADQQAEKQKQPATSTKRYRMQATTPFASVPRASATPSHAHRLRTQPKKLKRFGSQEISGVEWENFFKPREKKNFMDPED
jgi:hypothetical protein